jgi:hypothetical protein
VTFDYARAKATADRQIQRFGQTGSLRKAGTPSGAAYNPTPGTPVDHAARFAIVAFEQREIDGTRVLATDKKAILAKGALTVEPLPGDHLVDAASVVYSVVDVMPLNPAGTVVMYELQVRR